MKCEEAVILVNGMIDREISAETQKDVLLHLKECSVCTSTAKVLGILRAKLQQIQAEQTTTTAAVLLAHNMKVSRIRLFAAAASLLLLLGFVITRLSLPEIAPDNGSLTAENLPPPSTAYNAVVSNMGHFEQISSADDCCKCMRAFAETIAKSKGAKVVGFMCSCKKYPDNAIVVSYKGDILTVSFVKEEEDKSRAEEVRSYGEVKCYVFRCSGGVCETVFCIAKDEHIVVDGKRGTPDEFASLLSLKK